MRSAVPITFNWTVQWGTSSTAYPVESASYDTRQTKAKTRTIRTARIYHEVNDPTIRINSMVTVLKPNRQQRVCLDPRNLDRAIHGEK